MVESLNALFQRDIRKVIREIESFDEEKIWTCPGNISNSAGTLCIHLAGNLQHFIGAVLGKSGYRRDRHGEFYDRGIPVDEIVKRLKASSRVVDEVLSNFPVGTLEKEYPEQVFGKPMTTTFFLVHLQGHLNYHLGQITYLNKMLH